MSDDMDPAATPKAIMNLDDLEREGGHKQPFDFIMEGRRYILADPQEVDWQDLMSAMQDPHYFFQKVLPPDDHSSFFLTKLPSWKMNALMNAYQTHYGLPSPGEASGLRR